MLHVVVYQVLSLPACFHLQVCPGFRWYEDGYGDFYEICGPDRPAFLQIFLLLMGGAAGQSE